LTVNFYVGIGRSLTGSAFFNSYVQRRKASAEPIFEIGAERETFRRLDSLKDVEVGADTWAKDRARKIEAWPMMLRSVAQGPL
jgi:hypothetical protein